MCLSVASFVDVKYYKDNKVILNIIEDSDEIDTCLCKIITLLAQSTIT